MACAISVPTGVPAMILEPAPPDCLETNATRVFLGTSPFEVLGSPSSTEALRSSGDLKQGKLGSVLVLAGSNPETSPARIPQLLTRCFEELRSDGRLALLCANRAYGRMAWMRTLVPGTRSRADSRPKRAGLDANQAVEMVRQAGFADVKIFAVHPSAENPVELCALPAEGSRRAPAFLVTAGKSTLSDGFALERAMRAFESGDFKGAFQASDVLRVINSSRGKSVAIVKGAASKYVLRIARSAAMRKDEADSYQLLRQLAGNSMVNGFVPHAMGSEVIGDHFYFAQTHLDGSPLSATLENSNRAAYLDGVNHFLHALNPDLAAQPLVSFDSDLARSLFRPMTEFALGHVSDDSLRAAAKSMLDDSLKSMSGRLGVVHGDLGPGNVLVDGARLSGVIDWEAGRSLGPPVLDAINYLDSSHRTCNHGLSIVDSLPLLAGDEWPIEGELHVLRAFFEYCGIDFRSRRGMALLFAMFHFGPQLRFANSDAGPKRRLDELLRRLIAT